MEYSADSNRTFILIHGYTGYTDDFNDFAQGLHRKFNASVRSIPLMGHGTAIEALDSLTLDDFLGQVEEELVGELNLGKEIVLCGYSFGAQLAMLLAARYPVKGVVAISIPQKLKCPFNLPGLRLAGLFRKYWGKRIHPAQLAQRRNSLFYRQMHINGLGIATRAATRVRRELSSIRMPALLIHSTRDPIGHHRCLNNLRHRLSKADTLLLKDSEHNPFYSGDRNLIMQTTHDFIAKNSILTDTPASPENPKAIATAIVPGYNEAERIGAVLDVLTRCETLAEIIVVDDGSTDNTGEVVSSYDGVRYVRFETNRGKAHAMDHAVGLATTELLFFCDADLRDLTAETVTDIIQPVAEGDVDMFIGVRSNWMQRAITLFALNSGERALRKETWLKLPDSFKHRYRMEVGLNYFCKYHGKGFGWKIFGHYQTLKEQKYGFLRGTLLRWWMNFDVGSAYLRCAAWSMKNRFPAMRSETFRRIQRWVPSSALPGARHLRHWTQKLLNMRPVSEREAENP